MEILYIWVGLITLITSYNRNWGRGPSSVSSVMMEAGVGMWLFLDISLVLWYQPTCVLININLTSHFLRVFAYKCETSVLDTDWTLVCCTSHFCLWLYLVPQHYQPFQVQVTILILLFCFDLCTFWMQSRDVC